MREYRVYVAGFSQLGNVTKTFDITPEHHGMNNWLSNASLEQKFDPKVMSQMRKATQFRKLKYIVSLYFD